MQPRRKHATTPAAAEPKAVPKVAPSSTPTQPPPATASETADQAASPTKVPENQPPALPTPEKVPSVEADPALNAQRKLLKLSDEELLTRAKKNLAAMGSLSVGKAAGGALVGGVPLENSRMVKVVSGHGRWGTYETIGYLKRSLYSVYEKFPETPALPIGHISAKNGGPLAPHKSHQSGRDVDVSYFYRGKPRWYHRATAKNLDRARSWALVKALIVHSDVHYIFINSSVQKLLKQYALGQGEDRAWLDSIFQYDSKSPNPIIRHVRGHDTHLHVRFYNPVAQELARRLHPLLLKRKLIRAATRYRSYRARKGDLLSRIARRFGTSVKAIMKANGLRNSRIRAGRRYRIPQKQKRSVPRPPPLRLPPRRLPPSPAPPASR